MELTIKNIEDAEQAISELIMSDVSLIFSHDYWPEIITAIAPHVQYATSQPSAEESATIEDEARVPHKEPDHTMPFVYLEAQQELLSQLAEARKAAAWVPIDAEHSPKLGNEMLSAGRTVCQYGVGVAEELLDDGWTHYRPINAPRTTGETETRE